MINVNVISPELRRTKKGGLIGGIKIPLEIIVGSAGGLFVLLIGVHIMLLVINVTKLKTHKNLENKWAQILPDKQKVDGVITNMRQLQAKHEEIMSAVKLSDVIWAKKLNLVSLHIPKGVWLDKIALNEGVFYLDGSAIARGTNEMITVHKFTSNLTRNEAFMEHLTDLELGSIQTRTVDRTDIADFLITLKVIGQMHEFQE